MTTRIDIIGQNGNEGLHYDFDAKPILIGITGLKQSGKDTYANYLQKYFLFDQFAFADPIKEALSTLPGVFPQSFETEEAKNKKLPMWNVTPRELMQSFGTDWARNTINRNIWLECMAHRIQNNKRVVISDVRFDNEAQFIRERDGFIVQVNRPAIERKDKHESENGISPHLVDFVINNDSDLENLYRQGEGIANKLLDWSTDQT